MKLINSLKVLAFFTILPASAIAQHTVCGAPPILENKTLEADVKGKVGLLSKYIGDAELTGKIKEVREQVITQYPDAEATRANAYSEYQLCVLLMDDDSMSTKEKIEELKSIRREFSKNLSEVAPCTIDANACWQNWANANIKAAENFKNEQTAFCDSLNADEQKSKCLFNVYVSSSNRATSCMKAVSLVSSLIDKFYCLNNGLIEGPPCTDAKRHLATQTQDAFSQCDPGEIRPTWVAMFEAD